MAATVCLEEGRNLPIVGTMFTIFPDINISGIILCRSIGTCYPSIKWRHLGIHPRYIRKFPDQHHPPRRLSKNKMYHGFRITHERQQQTSALSEREPSSRIERSRGTITRKSSHVYESAESSLFIAGREKKKKIHHIFTSGITSCRHVAERSREDAEKNSVRKVGAQSDRNFIRRATYRSNKSTAFTFQ